MISARRCLSAASDAAKFMEPDDCSISTLALLFATSFKHAQFLERLFLIGPEASIAAGGLIGSA